MANWKIHPINEFETSLYTYVFFDSFSLQGEKEEETNTTLTLRIEKPKSTSKLVFSFGDSVWSHRITPYNCLFEHEMTIEKTYSESDHKGYGFIYCTEDSEYKDWFIARYPLTKEIVKNMIHIMIYDEEYYYEFLVDKMPEISYIEAKVK